MRIKNTCICIMLVILALSCTYLPEQENMIYENQLTETADYIMLRDSSDVSRAFVFYPGGLVDPHAYLGWMDRLVSRNDSLAIFCLKVTGNLSILDQKKAVGMLDRYPEIDKWTVGGHSLGGVVACFTVYKNPDVFDALIPMAAWSTQNYDLSNWCGAVLSLSAENDSLATLEEVNANKQWFPPEEVDCECQNCMGLSNYYLINGGNHAGFGDYGIQDGDGEADITVEQQHDEMVTVITEFMEALWD